jgi:hypothetical protein
MAGTRGNHEKEIVYSVAKPRRSARGMMPSRLRGNTQALRELRRAEQQKSVQETMYNAQEELCAKLTLFWLRQSTRTAKNPHGISKLSLDLSSTAFRLPNTPDDESAELGFLRKLAPLSRDKGSGGAARSLSSNPSAPSACSIGKTSGDKFN